MWPFVCLHAVLWCVTGVTLYHRNNDADCLICTIEFQYSRFHVPVIRFLRWDMAAQECVGRHLYLVLSNQPIVLLHNPDLLPTQYKQLPGFPQQYCRGNYVEHVVVLNRNRVLFRSILRVHHHMHGSVTCYSTALLLTVGIKHALQMYQIFMHSHIALNPALTGNSVL